MSGFQLNFEESHALLNRYDIEAAGRQVYSAADACKAAEAFAG